MFVVSGQPHAVATANDSAAPNGSVLTTELTAADARAYDAFVAEAAGGHYTQTRPWAAVAIAGKPFVPLFFLTRRAGKVIGAAVLLQTRLGLVPLPVAQSERGPVVAAVEDMADVVAALRRCCLKRGILRLSLMPYWYGEAAGQITTQLATAGFADCQHFSGRHVRSLRLDLTALDADHLFAASGLAKVRQNIGRAERAGASARPGTRADMAAFRALNEQLLAQEGRHAPDPAWYDALGDFFCGGNGAVFVCEYEGEVVSAILITLHNGIATYALGASSGRAMRCSKTVLAMAQAIGWARQTGAHSFDMGGVPMPGDPDKKRASIAEFKFSYSRSEITLVHEHRRWF
jgi:hypothetical protein